MCVALLVPVSGINHSATGVDGCTPLIAACMQGSTKSVRIILKAGADIDLRDHLDLSGLDYAAAEGHVKCVSLLLKQGAEVRWDHEKSPYKLAEAMGHKEVMKVLKDFQTQSVKEGSSCSSCTLL